LQWRFGPANGKKKSEGIEATLEKKADTPFYYSLGIALSSVKDQYANGKWYNDKNDVQATSTLILGSLIGKHHRLSVRFTATQGRPYADGLANPSETYYTERFFPLYSLNARYSFDYQGRRARFGAYVEILNILNQTPFIYQDVENLKVVSQRENGILPLCGIAVGF
jgi:hypothetical protein